MKSIRAERVKINIGKLWESPILHILLTKEDEIVVARCLDFTVSSHGKDENETLKALADSIKEYVLTALENDAIDTIFDPAHGKYWRMYNELEAKQSMSTMKRSLKRTSKSVSYEHLHQSTAEITHA